MFATIRLDTRGCGQTACPHPRFLKVYVSFQASAYSRYWRAGVGRCLAADMTVKERCALNKVAESSLNKWMARFREEEPRPLSPQVERLLLLRLYRVLTEPGQIQGPQLVWAVLLSVSKEHQLDDASRVLNRHIVEKMLAYEGLCLDAVMH